MCKCTDVHCQLRPRICLELEPSCIVTQDGTGQGSQMILECVEVCVAHLNIRRNCVSVGDLLAEGEYQGGGQRGFKSLHALRPDPNMTERSPRFSNN